MTTLTDTGPAPPALWKDAPYLAALRWANFTRMFHGQRALTELPCGTPGNADRCPLALAVGRRVRGTDDDFADEFIRRFDQRRYPRLIAR